MLGMVTPDITAKLQAELLKTKERLQQQIAQRGSLKLALQQMEEKFQKQVSLTEELGKTNKLLQRAICDRIATEAQLLQTTSELQELFQAFPDIYFRLKSDGTILSCHTKELSNLYLPLEEFLGKRMSEVLPPDIAQQFQQAVLQVQKTNSQVAIEYSLPVTTEKKSFEARLLPSIPDQIIIIVRDITERKQAQEALQRAKDELEIRVDERTSELKNTNERLRQEIIERQRIESELRYRIEFEKLITTISTDFINLAPNEIDNGINSALQAIGEFVNVDRSYVFLFADNDTRIDNIYKWCAKDTQGIIDYQAEEVIKKLCRFETIHIPDVSNLPSQSSQKQTLLELNIQSVIILPIVCSGLLIGYLQFDSIKTTKTWTEDSIALLKMVGEMLGNALERKRVEQVLRVSEERYARAINAGKVGIWECNIQTKEIYIAPNLKAMLGYAENEICNYLDDWTALIHPDDVEAVKVELDACLEGIIPKYELEHRMLHKDGSYMWFLVRGTTLEDINGKPCFIAGSNTDITARKLADQKIKASLKEKEVLLKEIHHRVKNNLQVISSLLRLQAGYIKDEQTLEIFRESQNRVRVMATIHETLYQSNDLAKIDFSDFINKLTTNLMRCYGIGQNIQIKLNINKVFLKIDTAITCGLIINELVSNCLKHAFKKDSKGKIYIEFLALGKGIYSLNVSDNGAGFKEDIELRRNQSLGLQLVWSLVEQLEGTIIFNATSGTSFAITFVGQN